MAIVLLTLLKIVRRHPEMAPSLRNAGSVLALTSPDQGGIAAGMRELLGRYEEHCAVAPLFAAAAAGIEAALGRTIVPAEFERHLLDLLRDRARCDKLLRWALSIQNFALHFHPKHTPLGEFILPKQKRIEYRFGLAAEEPELLDLSPAALKVAVRNRVPKAKATPLRVRPSAAGRR
jgi:hypothetical protein